MEATRAASTRRHRLVPSSCCFRQLVLELFEIGAAGHHLDQMVDRDLFLGIVAEDLAPLEDHGVISHRVGVVRVVGVEEHSDQRGASARGGAELSVSPLTPSER